MLLDTSFWPHKERPMETIRSMTSDRCAHLLPPEYKSVDSSFFLPFPGGYYLTSAYGALSLIKNFQEEQAARLLSSETRDTLRQWHKRRTTNRTIPSVDDFQVCGWQWQLGFPRSPALWGGNTGSHSSWRLRSPLYQVEKGYFKPPSDLVVSLLCFL